MHSRSPITRRVSLLLASLMIVFINSIGYAQATSYKASFKQNKEAVAVNVLVGQSRVINFDRPVGRFSVSNPEIAEAVLVTPDQVLVNGKAFGQVNFIAWEQSGGEYLVFDVYVRANLSLIDSQMRALFPKDDIRLSQANGSVVMSGSVSDTKTASQAQSVVEAAGFKAVNMLASPVKNMSQVQLQVRVAEVSRNRVKDAGASYAYQASPGVGGFASGGGPGNLSKATNGLLEGTFSSLNLLVLGANMTTMIRALQTQGALRALAEPNLIAMDGQEASFLAGGEYPVPVVQGGSDKTTVSITFKEYGVRLKFKPTIIDEDHIRLELEPEVSTSEIKSLSKVPVLGDIPVLGSLFTSKSFQKNETELMFIVTAHLVKPMNRDDLPQMRGVDGLKNGSPLGLEPTSEEIQGRTGFSVTGQNTEGTPAVSPKATEPAKAVEPATNPKTTTGTETGAGSSTSTSSNTTRINPTLPVAFTMPMDFGPQPLKP